MHPRITAEGMGLGKCIARMAEQGRNRLSAASLGDVDAPGMRNEMCASCACRHDTVPNGCLQTQLDLLKAVVQGVPFYCHAPRDGRMCAGWVAARASYVERPMPTHLVELIAQHEFSPPDEPAMGGV
jgi:hypothetical protein